LFVYPVVVVNTFTLLLVIDVIGVGRILLASVVVVVGYSLLLLLLPIIDG
jgi:hypothetical protein